MTERKVVNTIKDRCKTMQRVGDHYEWGWTVINRRDRTQDYFNKVGTGSYDEALQWMTEGGIYHRTVPKSIVIGQKEKA